MAKTNKDIFNEEIFNIPNKRNGQEFSSYVKESLAKFQSEIRLLNKALKVKLALYFPIIDLQIRLLNESIELYFKGLTTEAYNRISECLTTLNSEKILPVENCQNLRSSDTLFRVRSSDNYSLSKKSIFHIPFELREKVNTQRFSIPGLPCLYLGDSIYVCWEEMNRPLMENIHVSRFSIIDTSYNFLLLNATTNELRNKCFKTNEEGNFLGMLTGFLAFWPTLFCCSLIVDKPNDVFKPEYIIPQLILQWIVAERKLDGILYKSNKVSILNTSHSIGSFSNFVIPVKTTAEKFFCTELTGKIKFTNPVSLQLLSLTGDLNKVVQTDSELKSSISRVSYIELIRGEKTDYSKTKFGILENKLKQMKADFIDK